MNKVLQFKVSLVYSVPEIWRRIQISDQCTFWDLHVAIQDSMGWEDCHLHQFVVYDSTDKSKKRPIFIGIPDEDDLLGDAGMSMLAGWEIKVCDYLSSNKTFGYEYDFGDGWEHFIEFEGEYAKDAMIKKYPICLAGENACPPEDVGGIPGFYDYVEAITDKKHPDYKDCLAWHGKYDPTKFDATKVKFSNPKIRLKRLMEE